MIYYDKLRYVSAVRFTTRIPMLPINPTFASDSFEIEDVRQSQFALLLFTRHKVTSERLVIKILRKYKDTRYSSETIAERQKYQFEALQWNRVFTPEAYIGLAPVRNLDLDQKSIGLDKIIRNPTKEMLDPVTEYALIMHKLPEDRRLDYLLGNENETTLQSSLQLLTKRLADAHTNLKGLPTSSEDGIQWGSLEQLHRKLKHNLAFIEPMLKLGESSQYEFYDWLEETLNMLGKTLTQVFIHSQYLKYFAQRVKGQYIKRCHGDLKTPNIWIASYNPLCEEVPGKCVSILDVNDFYPIYYNIDILSDFALLVVDIQARKKTPLLANLMIEDYLRFTKQQEEDTRSVLAYYLVEKALVGAAISIVYDALPELAKAFLEVAEMRLKDLKIRLDT